MPSLKSGKLEKENIKSSFLLIVASFLIIAALFLPLQIFSPVIKSEINYSLNKNSPSSIEEMVPIDSDFSILIPKIKANTKVIKDVDPFNSNDYQLALTKGVAHAKTSTTPDLGGNTFIFAHSAGNWYQANQYNAVFYLLKKLVKGDQITLYYQGQPYDYYLTESKLVDSQDVDYLTAKSFEKQLTLMTCWPPGTTLKRLIIIAYPKND
jgi:LPXTG-site transpeptidase (sortase) family protein